MRFVQFSLLCYAAMQQRALASVKTMLWLPVGQEAEAGDKGRLTAILSDKIALLTIGQPPSIWLIKREVGFAEVVAVIYCAG